MSHACNFYKIFSLAFQLSSSTLIALPPLQPRLVLCLTIHLCRNYRLPTKSLYLSSTCSQNPCLCLTPWLLFQSFATFGHRISCISYLTGGCLSFMEIQDFKLILLLYHYNWLPLTIPAKQLKVKIINRYKQMTIITVLSSKGMRRSLGYHFVRQHRALHRLEIEKRLAWLCLKGKKSLIPTFYIL